MELAFKTKKLREICEDAAVAGDRFDVQVVQQLRRRLSDLRAAESPDDLVAGRPRLVETKRPRLVLDLSGGFELACEANHARPPQHKDGALDWSRVHRLKVVAIEGDTCD